MAIFGRGLIGTPLTEGGLIIGSGSDQATELPIGTATQILTSDGTTASWEDAPSTTTFVSLTDTPGVIGAAGAIYYSDGAALVALGIGTAGQILTVNGTADGVEWSTAATGTDRYEIVLDVGAILVLKTATATVPAGWTVQNGVDATNPNLGPDAVDLVVTHNLGAVPISVALYEIIDTGPASVQGEVQILLNTADVKSDLAGNAFHINDLLGKITTTRQQRIVMVF